MRVAKPLLLSINHYAIDFKKIYRVHCGGINENTIEKEVLECKKLELSVETRNNLRHKMAHYFGDVPKEDQV